MQRGDMIRFGRDIDWWVLHVVEDDGSTHAHLLSANILFTVEHIYGIEGQQTWETCDLRRYLNGDFYDNVFSASEKADIVDSFNTNPDNPWFRSIGGNPTVDKVFILSVEEVIQYFGDQEEFELLYNPVYKPEHDITGEFLKTGNTEDLRNNLNQRKARIVYKADGTPVAIDSRYSDSRIACFNDGTGEIPLMWYLRTPGSNPTFSTGVGKDGDVRIDGGIRKSGGGIRPAIVIKLNGKDDKRRPIQQQYQPQTGNTPVSGPSAGSDEHKKKKAQERRFRMLQDAARANQQKGKHTFKIASSSYDIINEAIEVFTDFFSRVHGSNFRHEVENLPVTQDNTPNGVLYRHNVTIHYELLADLDESGQRTIEHVLSMRPVK